MAVEGKKQAMAVAPNATKFVTLHNGVKIPVMGLGTWRSHDGCYSSVYTALQQNYRLLDTAAIYKNEHIVGEALVKWHMDRGLDKIGRGQGDNAADEYDGPSDYKHIKGDYIFVTSKVPTSRMGYDGVMKAYEESMAELKLSYLDLYLLHWPGMSGVDPSSPELRKIRKESWRAMEDLYNAKKVRAIGVCNYLVKHLDELMADGATIVPMVNQLELHPYCYYDELDQWAKKNKMILQAYGSLGSGGDEIGGHLLADPAVLQVAKETGRTPAQVLLRWAYQRGYLLIPKSVKEERIKENFQVFDFSLDDQQMQKFNSLRKQHHYCWNPEKVN